MTFTVVPTADVFPSGDPKFPWAVLDDGEVSSLHHKREDADWTANAMNDEHSDDPDTASSPVCLGRYMGANSPPTIPCRLPAGHGGPHG